MADTGRPPTLAAVAARAANAGTPATWFTVAQFGPAAPNSATVPVPGTDIAPPTDPEQVADEALAVQVASAGFRVHTWSAQAPAHRIGVTSADRAPVRTSPADAMVDKLFAGSVVINPDALNDPEQGTEILVTIAFDKWRPDFADSLMIALAYHHMAAAAARDYSETIMQLHSPTAPFRDPPPAYRGDGSGEAPRPANGLALRMLVSSQDDNSAARLTLLREIAQLATENGFGLQVNDGRLGRVKGQWWTVLPPDERKYTGRKEELFGWAPAGIPPAVRLVTLVGPARPGSSAAIAGDLLARNIGVLAVSEEVLQHTTFINLMVPIAPVRLAAGAPEATCLPITAGLGALASECGLTRRQAVRGRTRIGDTAATDYQVLSSGPIYPTIEASSDAVEHPVWLSWVLPHEPDPARRPPDVAELMAGQLREATDRIDASRVDYYRTHLLPDGRLNGRAKISLTMHDLQRRHTVAVLGELCPWAQREVEATLVRAGVPAHAIQIVLSWRERWLNRTNPLL